MTHENPKKDHWLIQYIKQNPLQVTLQLIGLGVLILNLWLANKLSPLVTDLKLVVKRVDAIEQTLDTTTVDLPLVKQDVLYIKENITEIKASVTRIEDSLFIVR